MPKWVKFIAAFLLLPACYGAADALWRVAQSSGGAATVWAPFFAGAACWIVIFALMPRPMWLYVFGHELTHVIWTWAFRGRVKKFKVGADGGQVVVTRSNFLIALAPYFFPFYAVVIVAMFAAGNALWNWQGHEVWFHLLIGAAYAFHVTLTWQTLKQRQTDITGQGYLFSAVIIFLGNAAVLLLGVPLLGGQVELGTALRWWLESTMTFAETAVRLVH